MRWFFLMKSNIFVVAERRFLDYFNRFW